MSMGDVAEKEQMCLEVAYKIMERDARGFA
jgi:hypothetical protein